MRQLWAVTIRALFWPLTVTGSSLPSRGEGGQGCLRTTAAAAPLHGHHPLAVPAPTAAPARQLGSIEPARPGPPHRDRLTTQTYTDAPVPVPRGHPEARKSWNRKQVLRPCGGHGRLLAWADQCGSAERATAPPGPGGMGILALGLQNLGDPAARGKGRGSIYKPPQTQHCLRWGSAFFPRPGVGSRSF